MSSQLCWRHVVINTHGSWLPGDRRGFRNRDHRIHSSGDYRNPPPIDEHVGLRDYNQKRAHGEIHIDHDLRPIVGRTIILYLLDLKIRVLALAVAKVHAHLLVELPDFMPSVKSIVGQTKRKSSRAIKNRNPGTVWSAGGTYKPVEMNRLKAVHDYIVYDQGATAWTWSFKDRSMEGRFNRQRSPTPG